MKRRAWVALGLGLLLAGCHRAALPPTAGAEADQPATVSVFFPTDKFKYLEAEARDVLTPGKQTSDLAQAAVHELLAGPIEEAHVRVIPKEARLLKLEVKGELATVDLSGEFASKFQGGSNLAALAVGSLVNTLTSVPPIAKVQILIDGAKRDDFAGAVKIGEPLPFDDTVMGGEKIGS
jgi:spore germination protein GerM